MVILTQIFLFKHKSSKIWHKWLSQATMARKTWEDLCKIHEDLWSINKILWFLRDLKICEICAICVPNKFLWFPWFLCDKYLFICEKFCTFVQPKNIYIYATSFYYIIRSCGASAEVLPLHPAAVSLDQIEISFGRRSLFGASHKTEAPHVSPLWSRQYLRLSRPSLTARPSSPLGRSGEVCNKLLPHTRAAITARFSCVFAPLTFHSQKPDFWK